MGKKFKLLKLTLIGMRKNYEVSFKDGLNYISGPTSTGKTSILEMINYALGYKEHKNYIEIGKSCTDVELEILINGEQYKIKRRLFDFENPVLIFECNPENDTYDFLDRFEIDTPSNPNSLSAFLLEKLDLSNIIVANQSFSFRDLFKYSYLKQTEIDNENIMGEKVWTTSIKRKPTFEIIFNIYDQLLAELKKSLKAKRDELKELEIKISGINEFIENTDMMDLQTYSEKKKNVEKEIQEKQKQLSKIKTNKKIDNEVTLSLQQRIVNLKSSIEKSGKDINDQNQYLNKLVLLRNQYMSEIDKIDFIIEGIYVMDKIDFIICPSCLEPIRKKDEDSQKCRLCGEEKKERDIDEIIALKHEKRLVSKRLKELSGFIANEEKNLQGMLKNNSELKEELYSSEQELLHLHKDYVNPYVEQIEQLNYEMGEQNRILRELNKNYRMLLELGRIRKIVENKKKSIEKLREKIKNTEESASDKDEIIKDLSSLLESILEEFKFPKLNNAYVGAKNYLPYVRGRLYRELGSLAGVTLITMAYYLSIAIEGREEGFNHLGLLIMDSPRKNLGAKASEEDFKDEEIFNSIIKYFIEVDKKYGEEIQLIVVNNGYPEFLDSVNIIKEFDGDGTKELPYGLIDDMLE